MEWFAILCAPRRELAAAEALRDRGFTVYVPTVRKKIGRRRVVAALFNRYIFVMGSIPWREADRDNPECIKDSTGKRMIIGPVTICGRHAPIHDHEVMQMAQVAALLDEEVNRAPKPSLKIGDIGIITSGPFEGKKGEIVRVGKSEAEVAMRIFNAVRIVRARLTSLEAAE
jgi:transcription antitermination factor NusG